jgi:hypothetical protein
MHDIFKRARTYGYQHEQHLECDCDAGGPLNSCPICNQLERERAEIMHAAANLNADNPRLDTIQHVHYAMIEGRRIARQSDAA